MQTNVSHARQGFCGNEGSSHSLLGCDSVCDMVGYQPWYPATSLQNVTTLKTKTSNVSHEKVLCIYQNTVCVSYCKMIWFCK